MIIKKVFFWLLRGVGSALVGLFLNVGLTISLNLAIVVMSFTAAYSLINNNTKIDISFYTSRLQDCSDIGILFDRVFCCGQI